MRLRVDEFVAGSLVHSTAGVFLFACAARFDTKSLSGSTKSEAEKTVANDGVEWYHFDSQNPGSPSL